ncbi:Uncharacterised protein [Mycobacterium tuberculosis]|nr:Uncharacterised protein [Mycobacterium tuberculosis]
MIDQFGSSRRSSTPSVALMMPAPISTTSVLARSDTGRLVPSLAAPLPGYPDGC